MTFLLSYPPSVWNFTHEWLKLTSICRKPYNLTNRMLTVLHRFSYVEMYVSLSQSGIPEDAMLDVLSTAPAKYVSSASFRAIQSLETDLFHVPFTAMSYDCHDVWNCLSIECSTVCSDWQKRNIKGRHYCPFVRDPSATGGSPHNGTVTRKRFPFDCVIM